MTERILVCVAWPYANGPLHLGHIAGCYLPADIFARYHRLVGNRVLMVSGSDQHGTPITVRAEQENKEPEEVANHYHQSFLESWEKLGISFDLFTRTGTENHARVTHDIFSTLLRRGYIYQDTMSLPYCATDQRFLPDRYVTGTCPHCGSEGARGDQCDECGKPLNPTELINARCRLCGSPPEIRQTEHFFLRLTAFEEQLKRWVAQQVHWKPNVWNFTSRFLAEGLRDRAITRDLEWGVRVPVAGFEHKRIYVWFEAVIGYLSASKEWAQRQGDPEGWRDFWQKEAKSYYFIGKDNISFHTIIWPAMLMGYGDHNLPYDVPANEFLTLEGKQFSTSRNWAVWLPDYLERYAPDPLRYLLSANMPDLGDADFSWHEFLRRNNDELVATYGNLVHRVLTFTYRSFEKKVPQAELPDGESQALLEKTQQTLENVGRLIAGCRFREALRTAMLLAQEANRYLDDKAPWKVLRANRQAAADALVTALAVIDGLKTVLYPFLPFSSERLHRLLGFSDTLQERGWRFCSPPAGQPLPTPEPLFTKLDDNIVAEETRRLEASLAR